MGLATEDEEEDLCFGSSGVGTRRPELEGWYRGSDGGEDLDIFSWPRTAVGWEMMNTALFWGRWPVSSLQRLP